MKNLLAWIKSNPLTVLALVVALASLGVIGWTASEGRAFRSEVQSRVDAQSRDIRSHISRSVSVPPERPDEESERINGVTITRTAIEQLERLYQRINSEYRDVFDEALAFNRAGHERLVPELFTDAAGPNVPHDARNAYFAAFGQMMDAPEGDDAGPRLNAGMPPEPDEIQYYLDQVRETELINYRPSGSDDMDLSDREQAQLAQAIRKAHTDMLRQRAEQIHLYAVTDADSDAFPFDVGEWGRATSRPEPAQLWEGQLELWIQQDIARAIARANDVENAGASVLDAPVKRLLQVEVVPGYVGIHTLGGLAAESGGGNLQAENGAYPFPEETMSEPDGELPVNFRVGPTGRISNPMYDVRHVRVVAVVDDQQLPRLFNALGEVNFMTVLNCNLREVDEYEALRDGFVYGSGNAMEAELIIETIWLREWTQEMMPQITRQYVGIDEAPEDAQTGRDGFPF